MAVSALAAAEGAAGADSDSPDDQCARLYDRAREDLDWGGLQRAWVQGHGLPADSLRARARLLAQTRSCYGTRRLDRAGYTYWYEAAAHAKLQQFPEAFDAFSDFFDRFHPVPDSLPAPIQESLEDQISEMYWTRGFLHYLLGDLTSAVTDYLSAFRAIPTSNRQRRATIIMDVGVIYQRLQDFDAAEQYFQRAERIIGRADSLDPDLRKLRVRALFRTADLILEREFAGRPDSTAFQQVFALVRQGETLLSDPDSDLYGKQLVLMTDASVTVGQIDSALVYNRRTLEWAQRNGDVHAHMLALFKRGWIEQRRGNWAASVSYLRQSLSMARHRRDLNTQRRILKRIGLAHEMQAEWEESEAAYRQAVAVVEAYRSSLRSTQWSLTAFSQWQDVYRGLVRTLAAQGRTEEAFRTLEKTRARHLTDLRIRSRVSETLPPRQRIRYDSLTRALTSVRAQLAKEPAAGADSLRNLESQLVADRRQLVVLEEPTEVISTDSLQNTLQAEDRAVVSYFLDDASRPANRPNRSLAFVVTADTLRAVPLPGVTMQSVEAKVEAVSPLFASSGSETQINAVHFDLRPLHDLYRDLYEPVAEFLPPERPLTILPDGPLYRLPFSTLVTEEPENRFAYESASYLLHERPTSLELSASLLSESDAPSRQHRPNDVVGMGVSTFNSNRTTPKALRSVLSRTDSTSSRLQLPSLPGVRREIRSLRRMAASGRFALDDEATESTFHATKHTAKVLHLASHSFVHPTSPLYNTFLLAAGDSSSSTDDGWLFLHEIQTEDASPIPLVVLSGCSTAEGMLRSGEGMEGLQYAFRAMGARSTVSNLWPASDDAAVELTRAFYRFLQDGHPKDVALQKAQAHYLATNPDQASPFYWAPTVLYGAPDPIPLDKPSLLTRLTRTFSLRSWILIGLVVSVLTGTAFAFRRDPQVA